MPRECTFGSRKEVRAGAVEAGSARVEAGGGAAGEREVAPWRLDLLGWRPEEAPQGNGRATGAVREGNETAGRRGVEASAACALFCLP